MEELQLALTTARVDQRNFGLWLSNWQVGQTLNALVTAQRPTGELVLRVGGQQITATSDIPIQQGARLLLEVKQLQPQPTLRILNPPPGPEMTGLGGTLRLVAGAGAGAGAGLASAPLAATGQGLLNLAAAAPAAATLLAPLVSQLRQLARPERLGSPDGLAVSLRGSGLFLEASLAAGRSDGAALAQDLKAGLFRALASAEGALARVEGRGLPAADVEALLALKRELEAGLGRVTLQQFNSTPAEGATQRQWHFELPVYAAGQFHSLQLTVERDGGGAAAGAGDEGDQWSARLSVDPPPLGRIDIHLSLRDDAVRLRLAAARADTRAAIDAQLPLLVAALASRGLTLHSGPVAALAPAVAPDEDGAASGLDLRA